MAVEDARADADGDPSVPDRQCRPQPGEQDHSFARGLRRLTIAGCSLLTG
jgi:hypothetical protein